MAIRQLFIYLLLLFIYLYLFILFNLYVFIFRVTQKMYTAQVVETSVTVNIQDYVHPDKHTQPTYEMTPGFKSFTK